MSSQPKRILTAQQYLELERASDSKNEFYRGRIYVMAGASRNHVRICRNVVRRIDEQFDGRPCEVLQSDMRVKVSTTGLYTYPDVVAFCHKPEFEDAEVDTLLNPQVIVEVLSTSTSNYDRGDKFEHYKRLDSVQCYILIEQNRPLIQKYVRQIDNQWLHDSCSNLDDVLIIEVVNCELKLSDIYARVEFEEIDPNSDFYIRESREAAKYIGSRPGLPATVEM